MRIYIAGPYTAPDQAVNVRNAILAADQIAEAGGFPFIPHLTHFWHMLCPHPYEFWMKQDAAWLKFCDAMVRLPGDSPGADAEWAEGRKRGLMGFYTVDECLKFLRSR